MASAASARSAHLVDQRLHLDGRHALQQREQLLARSLAEHEICDGDLESLGDAHERVQRGNNEASFELADVTAPETDLFDEGIEAEIELPAKLANAGTHAL